MAYSDTSGVFEHSVDTNLELRDRVLLVVNDHYRTNSSVLGATHIVERLGLEMNDENVRAVGTALRSLLSRGALSGIDPKTGPDSLPKIIVMGMTSRGEEMAEGLAGSGGVTAEFLLAEAKFVVEKKIAAIKDLEAKASAQLYVVGIGLGLLSIFGTSQPQFGSGFVPLVFGGAGVLLVALVLNLICVSLGRVDDLPQMDIYDASLFVRDKTIKARVSLSLTESYIEVSNELTVLGRRKGDIQRAATAAATLGVVALTLNYGWAALHRDTSLESFRLNCQELHFIKCEELEK